MLLHYYTLLFTLALVMTATGLNGQSLEEVIAAQQIDTILDSGPKDNRINFAIQNRGVDGGGDFADRQEFVQLFEDLLLKAFTPGEAIAKSPYAQYRNFFNLYAFWWPEALSDSEGWNFQLLHGVRDHFFLPWDNDSTGWITLFSTTRHGGGGGAGLQRDRRVGSGKMYGMGWETFLHEFGHTMPGQLDEYTSSGIWSNGACWETPNTTPAVHWEDIPWRKWIDEETPLPTPYDEHHLDVIGAFEGALTNFYGCYRPTARGCIMGAGGFGEDFGRGLCSPCIQRIICYLYEYVNPIESPQPVMSELSVTGDTTIRFSVDVVHPVPNTQQYTWILNGKVIAEDVLEVDVQFGNCESYELVFSVLDTNVLVRYDPKFEHIYPRPYKEHKWLIEQTDVGDYDLTLAIETFPANCLGEPSGMILAAATGGAAPYHYRATGPEGEVPLEGLAAGDWQVYVTDAAGCGVSATATVGEEVLLDAHLQASRSGDGWELQVVSPNYQSGELTYSWSNADTSAVIHTDGDGDYQVTVTTPSGCQSMLETTVIQTETPLDLKYTFAHTSVDKPSGRIYLDISGGRPPYEIEWWDSPSIDRTESGAEKAIASGTTWDHLPQYAFDDDLGTKWLHFTPNGQGGPPWIGFDFGESTGVSYYKITSANDVPARDPKDWLFQGSHDSIEWITLDEQSDQSFESRFLNRIYPLNDPGSYRYYRLYIIENHGDGATQIQELGLYAPGGDLVRADVAPETTSRSGLSHGAYAIRVFDQNRQSEEISVDILFSDTTLSTRIAVIPLGNDSVQVDSPSPDVEYFWFADKDASRILGRGAAFMPPGAGNFFVASYHPQFRTLGRMSGFAVTRAGAPLIDTSMVDVLTITEPLPGHTYHWYDAATGAEPVHTGTVFEPGMTEGYYYVAARPDRVYPEPVDPRSVDGKILQLDASDLDGDGQIDDPAPETSSMLQWFFPDGDNHWSFGSYFAYDALAQNGLGVADFATLWLQSIADGISDFQTILMVYEEDPLSFPDRAPFEALSHHMPRYHDSTRLFSDAAPQSTIDGQTYLNGEAVNPFTTANPMDFCVLGLVLDSPSDRQFFYTDTHWEGRVGEIILWDRTLSHQQMEGVSEHLRKKWISTADLQSMRTPVYWDGGTVSTSPAEKALHGYQVSVAPNPAFDRALIQADIPDHSDAIISIYDMSGVMHWSLELIDPNTYIDISPVVSTLGSGTYAVVLRSQGRLKAVSKLLITN